MYCSTCCFPALLLFSPLVTIYSSAPFLSKGTQIKYLFHFRPKLVCSTAGTCFLWTNPVEIAHWVQNQFSSYCNCCNGIKMAPSTRMCSVFYYNILHNAPVSVACFYTGYIIIISPVHLPLLSTSPGLLRFYCRSSQCHLLVVTAPSCLWLRNYTWPPLCWPLSE